MESISINLDFGFLCGVWALARTGGGGGWVVPVVAGADFGVYGKGHGPRSVMLEGEQGVPETDSPNSS